jgi:para-aminobenzoate synthetase
VKHLWRLPHELLVPIFGVCLGFQSLAVEFGGVLKRLDVVKHGQISRLVHVDQGLFEGIGDIDVVRYHSLHVTLPPSSQDVLERLAWTLDEDDNGLVVMAVAHRTKPFWAVQYHPESVCSTHGLEIITRFWDLASRWPRVQSKHGPSKPFRIRPWPPQACSPSEIPFEARRQVFTREVEACDLSAAYVCEQLNDPTNDLSCALLDSAAVPGRFSIVACSLATAQHITYRIGGRHILIKSENHSKVIDLNGASVWEWLCSFMDAHRAVNGNPDIPFWGGLIGFVNYSMGTESLIPRKECNRTMESQGPPDLSFVFVERSVVLDNQTGLAHVQSLFPNDHEWMDSTAKVIASLKVCPSSDSTPVSASVIDIPEKNHYLSQIRHAQEYLASGDSYELCLTARTRVQLEGCATPQASRSRAWKVYNCLRSRNGAPFSCFLRLGPTTLVGSSPERFLSFTREGHCQLRPIKGTASKRLFPHRKDAEAALSVQKEFAENLMIVDLIRHDLHGITGAAVHVPKLCAVEEYETVWQLVSVIEGQTKSGSCARVLGASLPPGKHRTHNSKLLPIYLASLQVA